MSNPYQPPDASSGMPPGSPYQPGGPFRPGGDGLAITSLVCGLLGILSSFCCLFISLPLSLAALITGSLSISSRNRGLAIAGIVCGAIGLLLTIAAVVLGIVLNWDEITS